jgi:hypothetical protein
VLALQEARERRRGRVVQPLPDRAHLAAAAAVEQPLHLVLVLDDGGEQLARRLGAARDLGARGQELEEFHDDGVEHVLADLAQAVYRAGEALHVGLGEVAQEARGELGADRGQDHRRLLDRSRLGAERERARLLGLLRHQRGLGRRGRHGA